MTINTQHVVNLCQAAHDLLTASAPHGRNYKARVFKTVAALLDQVDLHLGIHGKTIDKLDAELRQALASEARTLTVPPREPEQLTQEQIMAKRIEWLNLPRPIIAGLLNQDARHLHALVKCTPSQLIATGYMDQEGVDLIAGKLANLGLALTPDPIQ